MSAEKIRQLFLEFFKKKGHTIVPSSSLIPEDPSVLLTTAGMQQFKPYYTNEKSPYGDDVVSVQKCFRTSDIDSVGDESHLTFFEMLGNFSFGGYFKKDAIKYAYEFITSKDWMNLKIDYVSVFGGDKEIPEDKESENIWKEIDGNLEIRKTGKEDNFWGPTGDEGPCGPTTEIYVNGVEIWNIVFNEYYRNKEGKFIKLEKPGVDTGMGLERLAMVSQKKKNIFETDLFELFKRAPVGIGLILKSGRIFADHIRGAIFLIADGVRPSNKGAGYILGSLIQRIIYHSKKLTGENEGGGSALSASIIQSAIKECILFYGNTHIDYKNILTSENIILEIFKEEQGRFEKNFSIGLKEFYKLVDSKNKYSGSMVYQPGKDIKTDYKIFGKISGKDAFYLHQTFGFRREIMKDICTEQGIDFNDEEFNNEFKKHQQLSRTASAGMFKSGLADHSEQATKYHTATHLLLAALRQILGDHVFQKGSNITAERLRFDFSHQEKLASEQIKQVEDLVNQKIQEDLPVKMEETNLEEAKKQGAMGVFEAKYAEKVKVYTIGDFSKEICGGPHIQRTGDLGHFKIVKEEASSAGVRRIKAVLE